MKRKLTPGSGVGEDVVPEWSTGEDRPVKRLGVEDTSSDSSGSEGLGDESSYPLVVVVCCNLEKRKSAHVWCG
jgi:hypothetical protein